MFIRHRSQGIVLKKVNRREADQLFTVYTKDFGKIKVLGRGIRKISSKLKSGMEPFYLSEVEFIQGKSGKTLTDVFLIDSFRDLRKDLKRLNIAYRISELLDNLIYGEEPEKKVWILLSNTLRRLDNRDFKIKNPKIIYYHFLWNLFSVLGYRPELYQCSSCGEKLKLGKLYFNEGDGGVICSRCFSKKKLGKEIDSDAVKILRVVLDGSEKIISKLSVEERHFKLLEEISKKYIEFVSEKSH